MQLIVQQIYLRKVLYEKKRIFYKMVIVTMAFYVRELTLICLVQSDLVTHLLPSYPGHVFIIEEARVTVDWDFFKFLLASSFLTFYELQKVKWTGENTPHPKGRVKTKMTKTNSPLILRLTLKDKFYNHNMKWGNMFMQKSNI